MIFLILIWLMILTVYVMKIYDLIKNKEKAGDNKQ